MPAPRFMVIPKLRLYVYVKLGYEANIMQIESTLDTYKYNFKHPMVRDLAWAIASPPLLETEQGAFVSVAWLQQQYLSYLPRLFSLDNNPTPLLEFINRQPRLGVYFEQLWHFFFEDSPKFDVLLANIQIQDSHQTYGEFDFIVREKATQIVTHFEVAVKFYLGYQHVSTTKELWYGANIKDRLDIKIDHMLKHQIRLGHLSSALAVLKQHNITIDDEKIILKGRLYQPHPDLQFSNSDPALNTCNWTWLTAHCFKNSHAEFCWYRLLKPDYLAPRLPEEVYRWHSDNADSEKKPLQLLRYKDQKEAERLFLVPDEWLTKLKDSNL
jgi:hypothetical protein